MRFFASLLISSVASAIDHETQCFNDVQGKITETDEKLLGLMKMYTRSNKIENKNASEPTVL